MMQAAQQIEQEIKEGQHQAHAVPVEEATLLAPVPRPNSFRDAYAFRQHVATSRRNRGLEMIPEFDEFPVLLLQSPGHRWAREYRLYAEAL